jgi:hypothetical protein
MIMNEIIVVTGLPRSGTSLMMQILEKAGLNIYSDGVRQKDDNNPEGYYELEAVKGIVKNNQFLKEGIGKVIKIVAPLPMFMDKTLSYKAIFMIRNIDEVLRSQEVMLHKDQSAEREKFRKIYEGHIEKTIQFFRSNNIPYVEIHHRQLIQQPELEIQRLLDFIGVQANVPTLTAVVNPDLYRNKHNVS